MPLDFRTTDEEERLTVGRFLKIVGLYGGVFLVFLVVGHYGVAPLLYQWLSGGNVSEQVAQEKAEPSAQAKASLPKVEVYEKLPPDVVVGSGLPNAPRQVAPYDYEAYQQARERKRQQKPPTDTQEQPPSSPDEEEELIVVPDEIFFSADREGIPSANQEKKISEESLSEPSEPSATPPSEPPTEPPPVPPPETPSPPRNSSETATAPTTRYRVQVGVFENRENANNTVQRLIANGFEASIVPVQHDGRTLYRVQVLVTRDRQKAEQVRQQLESLGFSASIVPVE